MAEQYIHQRKKAEPNADLVSGVKRDFRDTVLVGDENHPGYATDTDLKNLVSNPSQAPSQLAVDLIAARTDLAPATVLTYTKQRRSGKKSVHRAQKHSPRKKIT